MTQLLKYKSGKMTALSVIVFTATIVAMLASCDTAQLEIPEVQLTLRLSLPETGEYARTRAITADEENAIDIGATESIGLQGRRNFRALCL